MREQAAYRLASLCILCVSILGIVVLATSARTAIVFQIKLEARQRRKLDILELLHTA